MKKIDMAKKTATSRIERPKLSDVLHRRFVGLHVSGDCRGSGYGNPGYLNALYEVTRWDGTVCLEHGPSVRKSAYAEGTLYEIFKLLWPVFSDLAQRVTEEEDFG
jgi:hypothetical protein